MLWEDFCAYLDWAALRPMTELEYEKAARGPLAPVALEYAWGSTNITQAVTISTSPELGLETITTASANAAYGNMTFSRGDDFGGLTYAKGPLRVGIFATSSSTRENSGAGYYGVMELSGNLLEAVVSTGLVDGRVYTGLHGDGVLVTTLSYEGLANTTNWPGNTIPSQGVTSAIGTGAKGGSYQSGATRLRLSDRVTASSTGQEGASYYGGRGVRTYDGP